MFLSPSDLYTDGKTRGSSYSFSLTDRGVRGRNKSQNYKNQNHNNDWNREKVLWFETTEGRQTDENLWSSPAWHGASSKEKNSTKRSTSVPGYQCLHDWGWGGWWGRGGVGVEGIGPFGLAVVSGSPLGLGVLDQPLESDVCRRRRGRRWIHSNGAATRQRSGNAATERPQSGNRAATTQWSGNEAATQQQSGKATLSYRVPDRRNSTNQCCLFPCRRWSSSRSLGPGWPTGSWGQTQSQSRSLTETLTRQEDWTYILSMSSFSSRAPGRSLLLPRTRTWEHTDRTSAGQTQKNSTRT